MSAMTTQQPDGMLFLYRSIFFDLLEHAYSSRTQHIRLWTFSAPQWIDGRSPIKLYRKKANKKACFPMF